MKANVFLVAFVLGIVASSAVVALADLKNDSIKVICAYLENDGHKTGTWKKEIEGDDTDDAYFACSPKKEIGTGAVASSIAYYVTGKKNSVEELSLTLNVFNRAESKLLHGQLLSAGSILIKKATGQPIPKQIKTAIEQGKGGEWKVGAAKVKIVREEFPSGKGYDLSLIIK